MNKTNLTNITIVFTAIILSLCTCAILKSNRESPGINVPDNRYAPVTETVNTTIKSTAKSLIEEPSIGKASTIKHFTVTTVVNTPTQAIKQFQSDSTTSTTKVRNPKQSAVATENHVKITTTKYASTHSSAYKATTPTMSNQANKTGVEKYRPANAVKTLDKGVWLCDGGGVIVLLSDMSYFGFRNEEEYIKSVNAAKNPACPYCGSKNCKSLHNYYAYNGTNICCFCQDPQDCPVVQNCNGITGETCPDCGKLYMVNYYYICNGYPDNYCPGGCTWTMT